VTRLNASENKTEKAGISRIFKKVLKMKKKQISRGKLKEDKEGISSIFSIDKKGREYVDMESHLKAIQKEEEARALLEHGNDINKRLDIGKFPSRDRHFMMTYDKSLSSIKINFDSFDWALFWGDTGTGKTTLAIRLAVDYMNDHPTNKAYFLSVSDWLRSIQNSFNDSQHQAVKIEGLPDFLVLDDFDKTTLTKWQKIQLFHLIDVLYKSERQVIITMNLSLRELVKEEYDVDFLALIDRIKDRTIKNFHKMKGESYRAIFN